MSRRDTNRANTALRCEIRLSGADKFRVRGVIEEIARELLVVIVTSTLSERWLQPAAKVLIAIDLPFTGAHQRRILECAASVSRIRPFDGGVRVVAEVQRMTFIDRDPAARTKQQPATRIRAGQSIPAVERPQNAQPVIPANHPTSLNSNSTGEPTMSFLKKFLNEEDGQDMVEYGLVIALVVIGAAAGYTAFKTQITGALKTLGENVDNQLSTTPAP